MRGPVERVWKEQTADPKLTLFWHRLWRSWWLVICYCLKRWYVSTKPKGLFFFSPGINGEAFLRDIPSFSHKRGVPFLCKWQSRFWTSFKVSPWGWVLDQRPLLQPPQPASTASFHRALRISTRHTLWALQLHRTNSGCSPGCGDNFATQLPAEQASRLQGKIGCSCVKIRLM